MNKTESKIGINIAVLILISLIVVICTVSCAGSGKDNADTQETTTAPSQPVVLTTAYAAVTEPVTTIAKIASPKCNAAAVYSVDTEEMLYADNIDKKTAPASLTKLLTAMTAIKYVNLDDVFMVSSEQYWVDPYSSLCYLEYGNYLTMKDLITGMLIASGNDAAYTIAVSTARTVAEDEYMEDEDAINSFCKLMNETAKEIGMTNSHFTNPDGWDEDGQYTTAEDLLKLTEYALSNRFIKKTVGTQEANVVFESGEPATWVNSNQLLDQYSEYYCRDAIGVKTGTTLEAGNNLIAAFEKNDKTYITVVEGCETDEERYELTLKLYNGIE